MDTFGQRLRRAIEEWGSIRAFQRAMEERLADTDVDGYSYPSINEYLKGEVSPRLAFVEHAAAVLGVRPAWLVTGDGEPTDAEEAASRYGADSQDPATRLLQAIRHRYGGFGEDHLGISRSQQRLFLQLLVRYVQAAPDGNSLLDFEQPPEELLEIAGDLHFLVWLPLQARSWGFKGLDYRGRHQLNEYATAMMHALSLWIQEAGEGLPVANAENSILRRLRRAAGDELQPDGSAAMKTRQPESEG